MSSIGAFQMSSRKPVSTARPQTFWSTEYGDFLLWSIGRPRSSAYAIASLPGPGVVADRRDHLQFGGEVGDAHLEAHLVVALAGAAVGHRRGAVELGGLGEVPDDQRPGQRGDQRVAVHVERVGPQRGQAEVLGELVLGVDHDGLDRAAVQGALTDDVHVLTALADVDGHRHHFLPGLLGHPADADTGVEPAGVGQDNPIAHVFVLFCTC